MLQATLQHWYIGMIVQQTDAMLIREMETFGIKLELDLVRWMEIVEKCRYERYGSRAGRHCISPRRFALQRTTLELRAVFRINWYPQIGVQSKFDAKIRQHALAMWWDFPESIGSQSSQPIAMGMSQLGCIALRIRRRKIFTSNL